MQFVPYNAFQKVMRIWDEVHPYNAAQIMKLEGRGDYDKHSATWRDTLSTLGIGRIIMQGATYAHCAWNGEPGSRFIDVAQPTDSLEDYLTREINRPFLGPEYCPFRPFVIQENDAHYVGVIYHHWPADSGSIKTLLREWYRAMYCPGARRMTPLTVPEKGYWHYFGPKRAKWNLIEGILSLLRYRFRFARVRRVPIHDDDDFTVRISHHPQPDGMAERLLKTARARGVTVNDIFLAAMAETMHTHGVAPQTFDDKGWLRIGFCGHQPGIGENYISTGSLYLCAVAFLPLGLPSADPFWSAPTEPTTQQRAWSGRPFPIDHAIAP